MKRIRTYAIILAALAQHSALAADRTLWPSTATPAVASANDASPVELGVRFSSSVPGRVTAVRFYKGSLNAGPHTGRLWTSTGQLLGSVAFASETASGWQQANFASPITIAANTTYVVSYFAPSGGYAYTSGYFAAPYANGSLTAPAGQNGVYAYGTAGTFPAASYNSTNYWVDVVFVPNATSDTILPTVSITAPTNGALVTGTATVSAAASDNVGIAAVQFLLDGNQIGPDDTSAPYSAAWDSTAIQNGAHTLVALARDLSGNYGKSNPVTISVNNPIFDPAQGPGGPILIITSAANPFSAYYAEILRTEGFNAFAAYDVATITAKTLLSFDLAILGDFPITSAHATMLSDWVRGGGQLIAMKPSQGLHSLLGISGTGITYPDGYYLPNASTLPGKGITAATMQYHGTANAYLASGATPIATLYNSATSATPNPAATLKSVGSNGGAAAMFSFDVARSIVLTRQGNPAWTGQERDGISPIRPNDLFYGGAPGLDYVNLGKAAIPQADELQRMLANLIVSMNNAKRPLPRFWYFPRMLKAVLVPVGDDHGTQNGTASTFDLYNAASPAGCSVANWTCYRATSLIYPYSGLTAAQAGAYDSMGFEIGVHVNTGCADWTPASLDAAFQNDLANFRAAFPGLAPQKTTRTHCIAYSDYDTSPQIGKKYGTRLDLNYYYWPGSWIRNKPGFLNGSGMAMRHATSQGAVIDSYQLATNLVNENGVAYPAGIDTMLDNALGTAGYYGVFGTHFDYRGDGFEAMLLNSARTRGVPLVSGRQLLTWLDARGASSFRSIAYSGSTLTFSIDKNANATGLYAMIPCIGRTARRITRNGASVPFTTSVIKGITYAVFTAETGSYSVAF